MEALQIEVPGSSPASTQTLAVSTSDASGQNDGGPSLQFNLRDTGGGVAVQGGEGGAVLGWTFDAQACIVQNVAWMAKI